MQQVINISCKPKREQEQIEEHRQETQQENLRSMLDQHQSCPEEHIQKGLLYVCIG